MSGSSAIINDTSNKQTEPSFIYSDASDIGLIMVVVTYDDIPSELHLEEHLSSRTVADTSWASAKAKLGMVQSPMFAPIFFGQKTIVSSVHNPDFEDHLGGISPAHHQWAQLMKEQLIQEENDIQNLDAVIDCLSKLRNKAESMKMLTAGFGVARTTDLTFLSVFTLLAKKWALQQTPLCNFFVGNPSPICNSQPPSRGSKAHVDFSPQEGIHMNLDKAPDSSVFPKNSSTHLSNESFNPMAFLKLWGDKMQLMQQQPQKLLLSRGPTSLGRPRLNSTTTCCICC
jgi:hypothetical protein